MKRVNIGRIIAILVCLFVGFTADINRAVSGENHSPLTWEEDELVLTKALQIRATALEQKSGFYFDRGWPIRVEIEWSVGSDPYHRAAAEYSPERKVILFPRSLVDQFNRNYRPLYLSELDPAVVAQDEYFAQNADHELGHLLIDQISRKFGQQPFFTEEYFYSLTVFEMLGLKILSEGVAEYFESINFPTDVQLSEFYFPENLYDSGYYTYDIVVRKGGHWLVKDILDKYHKGGLIWIVNHLFVVGTNIRQSAIEYKDQALQGLAGLKN